MGKGQKRMDDKTGVKLSDLLQMLKSHDGNFIAFVYTPWHAHGVKAVLKMLAKDKIEPEGYVCICSHQQAGYILDKKDFEYLPDGIEAVRIQSDQRLLNPLQYLLVSLGKIDKSADRFYLVTPNELDCKRYSDIRSIIKKTVINYVVDEGLATYMRKEEDFYKDALKGASFLKKQWIRFRLAIIDKNYRNKIIKQHLWVDCRLLCYDKKGRLVPNRRIIPFYRQAIHDSTLADDSEFSSVYKDAIVLNTQPFYEEGALEDEDIQILTRICAALHKQGFRIVLKPHPREKNICRYNGLRQYIEIDERKGITQESILDSLDVLPKAVVGFSSTTLVTCKLFYNIPCVSLARMFDYTKIQPGLYEEERRFLKTFSSLVKCPGNRDGFLKYINSI